MSPTPDTQLAIEALAALEMDQLERAVKLAATLDGALVTNGLRDYVIGTVLARRGDYDQALALAMALYGQDASRVCAERLRTETLGLMQGIGGAAAAASLLEEALRTAPVAIDPLQPLNHAVSPSPLGPQTGWRELFTS
jgi:hypothetical protein